MNKSHSCTPRVIAQSKIAHKHLGPAWRTRSAALLIILYASAFFGIAGNAVAQNQRIRHVIAKQHLSPPAMGREFWWAQPSNYWGEDLGGKYIRIYITSPQNTTAYVGIGPHGAADPITVQAYKIGSYFVKNGWEMESSGIVEPKAIHVWSRDADLTVYVMSHNAYTSDGSYIIPTIGWGTDYVVAAYGSLYEANFDVPSEFTITANVDNTTVSITPSTDLRQCHGQGDNPTVVVYPRGHSFTVALNRGECAQYVAVQAQNSDDYDVTGTIVHSNNPVGILGGSQCPNIPSDFPYCDHVEDMIPPVRTWAQTYYTTNFISPPGYPNHDFGLYLFISSKPGQQIFRQDYVTGTHSECIIDNQYGTYWDELESAQKFWSNAPFLLVEYINSASYPDNAGLYVQIPGDPAEVVVNPREQYTKTVVFQTPISQGAQLPYDSYASVIVNRKDEKKTTFDKLSMLAYTHQQIDDTFEVFTVPHIAPGAHIVSGDDSGVGVYVYGYGNDESYAWTGSFGTGTFQAKDTIAPRADTTGACYAATIHFSDSGINPGGILQSKLSEIRLDSNYNMAYMLNPDWLEGAGLDTGGYSMFVLNLTKPAYLRVEAYDLAGNETTVISTYTPQTAQIDPPLQNLGASIAGTIKYSYDTIINTGQTPFKFDQLKLLYGNVGFTLDSGMTPNVLAVGEKRILKIAFQAVKSTTVTDSILFGDECQQMSVAVIGSGGSADFLVSDQRWVNEPVPAPAGGYVKAVTVENLSQISITIDSAWWVDKVHFVPVDTFPLVVPASNANTGKVGEAPFRIAYFPDKNSIATPDRTQGNWQSLLDGKETVRNDSLVGNGVSPSEVFVQNIDTTVECVQPGDTLHLSFELGSTGSIGSTIERVHHTDPTDFLNLTGKLSSGTTWNPGTSAQAFAPGETATITVDYPEPAGTNTTAVDSLTAINEEGDTVGGAPIKVTVHVVYRAGQVQPQGAISFGTLPYQTAPFATKQFVITNSTQAPLAINNIIQPAGGKYQNSFTITTVPPMPDTLQPGENMTVTVTFNDSLSFDAVQTSQLNIDWDACAPQSIPIVANTTVSGAAVTGYSPTPILSCDQATNNVTVTNTQPHGNALNEFVMDTVISASWIGANRGANFSISDVTNDTIRSGNSLPIPVTFIPGSQKGLITYTDSLQVILRNDRGVYDTVVQAVSGIAGTALVSANSQFATDTGAAGDGMSVPATINVNKEGLILPTAQLGITGIELTYVIPHPDLLIRNTPSPFTIDPNLAAAGWTSSIVPNAAGVRGDSLIVVKLTGTSPLTDPFNASTLGQLQFQVALDKSDSATPVTLQSIQLYSGANSSTPVGSCIDTAVTSSGFALIIRCGDGTLRGIMSGQGIINFTQPATPDPVRGSTVTFHYANRGETNITLAIYDLLGREVARPVDNVNHDAGAWQVSYDVSKLPSGTYTYRLSSKGAFGETALSKQFIIQR
ncbi:MAG TPA: hypothetical protein VFD13_00445 [Candidatus Kapabacteria bacterium]|nr:hypothetical protein [Candidatus Kapabacteria bacterium]